MPGWVPHGTGPSGGSIVVGRQIEDAIDIASRSYDFGQLVVGHVPPVEDGLRHEVSHYDNNISRNTLRVTSNGVCNQCRPYPMEDKSPQTAQMTCNEFENAIAAMRISEVRLR